MQTTNQQLITFFNVATNYLTINRVPTKLTYALAKMQKRCQKVLEKFNNKLEDLRLESALEDEKTKAVLMDERENYKLSKESTKKIVEERRKMSEETVEIEPYFATSLPDDLSNDFRVEFEGFVIKPEEV